MFQAFIWWFIHSCYLSSLFSQDSYLLSITLKAFIVKNLFEQRVLLFWRLLQKVVCETVCQLFSDQEQSLPIPIMIYLYASLLWLMYLLQAKLYNGELLSSMSCAMVSVMLLVSILLSTLHSINLWTCLLSSVFAWRQAKVWAWGELIRPICIMFSYCYL